MNYAKFKIGQMKRQVAEQGIRIDGVTFNLTNLKVAYSSELVIGSAYTCTLEPKAGYYLPQMISVTGTTSTYGFKYDYTTGVIYIPSDEIIGDIVITAVADNVNNNVPAVLKVVYDTIETPETGSGNGVLLNIAPSRGSTVSVTLHLVDSTTGEDTGSLTKTITGDMTTETYNSPAKLLAFYDSETSEIGGMLGDVTIEGAYEGYGTGIYDGRDGKGNPTTVITSCLDGIIDFGRPMSFTTSAFEVKSTVDTGISATSLPDSLIWLDSRAFYGCANLALTSLPPKLKAIGHSGMSMCKGLTCTESPESLTSLDVSAFNSCTNLALTSLSEKLTVIPQHAFNGCTSLALTSLPEGLIEMHSYAFSGCTNLALTSLPEGLKTIASNAFYGCTNLALTSLPEGTTNIYTSAFEGCTNLALTSLPEGVTNISDYAFRNCTNLALTSLPESIKLPSGAMYGDIGISAFYGCTNIITMTIPSGVTKIEDTAFEATGLKTVIMRPTTPPTLGTSVFPSKVETITVPIGSGEAYKAAASWADYVDKIVEGTV